MQEIQGVDAARADYFFPTPCKTLTAVIESPCPPKGGRPGNPGLREDERDLGVTPRAGSRAPKYRPHPRSHARWRCEEGQPSSPAPSGAGFSKHLHQVRDAGGCYHRTMISAELLEVLACPKCKRKVELSEDGQMLICEADRLRYPIVDGIPVMLV